MFLLYSVHNQHKKVFFNYFKPCVSQVKVFVEFAVESNVYFVGNHVLRLKLEKVVHVIEIIRRDCI